MGLEALVIVRAYGGRPLKRSVQKRASRAIFVSNPESKDGSSMGFPVADVFVFDQPIFDKLQAAFASNGSVPPSLWDQVVPFGSR
ncbi:MAG: hypothetical protein LUO93_02100 [Methanomicrobiales archaeon]|nr:hypothetical protein [Methanomicrobiales archaeon]